MSITSTFVALDRETNFEKLEALASVVPFKILSLDVILMWRVLGTRSIVLGR